MHTLSPQTAVDSRRLAYRFHRRPVAAVRFSALPQSFAEELLSAADWHSALRRLVAERDDIRAAIRLSSKSLHDSIVKWLGGEEPKNKRFYAKLLLYVLRMSSRPTPFGLFSGIAPVDFGEAAEAEIKPRGMRVTAAPHWEAVHRWLSRRAQEATAREEAPIRVNDAFQSTGLRLRITKVFNIASGESTSVYPTAMILDTEGVEFVRRHAGLNQREMRQALAGEFGATEERCATLLDGLRRAGFILPADTICPIGDPVREIIDAFGSDLTIADTLGRMQTTLSEFSAILAKDITAADIDRTEGDVRAILQSDAEEALNVTLHHPFLGTLPTALERDLAYFGELQCRMALGIDRLEPYRRAFVAHVDGMDALMPLLEFSEKVSARVDQDAIIVDNTDHRRLQILADLVATALRTGEWEVVLDDAAVNAVLPPVGDLPASLEIGARIAAPKIESLERGDYLISPMPYYGANRTARSVGRFLPVLGPDYVSCVRQGLEEEGRDAVPRVELVYAPTSSATVNVSSTPRLLDVELQIGIFSASDGVTRLGCDDIYVGLDDGRLFLWSQTLKSEITLHEGHLLSHMNAPPLLAFLKRIVQRGTNPTAFSWGALGALPFLPRLRYGKFVLSPATWKIDITSVRRSRDPLVELRLLAAKWNIPDDVLVLSGADNHVPLRFSSPAAWAIIDGALGREAERMVLTEHVAGFPSRWLVDEKGDAYSNELVVSLMRDVVERPRRGAQSRTAMPVPRVGRHRSPVSEWTYVKAECFPTDVDELIRLAYAFQAELREKGLLDRWFFVRYSQPQHHLRLRFRAVEGHEDVVRGEMMSFVRARIDDGIVEDFGVDTYRREIERYGGPNAIAIAESVFDADSTTVGRGLAAHQRSHRYDRAVLGAFDLLRGLLGADMATWFASTHSPRVSLNRFQRDALRRLQTRTTELLGTTASCAEQGEAYRRLQSSSDLTRPYLDIVSALVHMHFNRAGLGDGEAEARPVLNALVRGINARGSV